MNIQRTLISALKLFINLIVGLGLSIFGGVVGTLLHPYFGVVLFLFLFAVLISSALKLYFDSEPSSPLH